MYWRYQILDLLDEIANDKSFAKKTDIAHTCTSDRRILVLEIETEALILILQAKGIFTEKEFELAGNHIIEEFATQKSQIDDEFMKKRLATFYHKLLDFQNLEHMDRKPYIPSKTLYGMSGATPDR